MKDRKRLAVCWLAALLFATPALAWADVVLTFDVSGAYGSYQEEKSFYGGYAVERLEEYVSDRFNTEWKSGRPAEWTLEECYGSGATIPVTEGEKPDIIGQGPYYIQSWGYGLTEYYEPGELIFNGDGSATRVKDAQTPGGPGALDGIRWATDYLYQANVNERDIDFRLLGDGVKLAFALSFEAGEEGGYDMILTVRGVYEQLKPLCTLEALAYLEELDVRRVRVGSYAGEAAYDMNELENLAEE